MVILYDAIKTIQNGVFAFFFKEQKPVSFQENKKIRIEKNRWVVFFKKTRFSQPRLSFKTL